MSSFSELICSTRESIRLTLPFNWQETSFMNPTLNPTVNPSATSDHKVVSESEWLRASSDFLAKEKELTRMSDDVSRRRRSLPWTRVQKSYVFDGPRGKVSLADLFDGRSQLAAYHFMLGPDWVEGCPGCSYLADHVNGTLEHLHRADG